MSDNRTSIELLMKFTDRAFKKACEEAAHGNESMREYFDGQFVAFWISAGFPPEFEHLRMAKIRRAIYDAIRAMRLRLEEK